MNNRNRGLLLLVFSLWLVPSTGWMVAQGNPVDSLRGIGQVKLSATVTETLEFPRDPKTKVRTSIHVSSALARELTQRLRDEAGVQVVDDETDRGGISTGMPYLFLTVVFLTSEEGLYTQRVELSLRQMAMLIRDPTIPNVSWTWKSQYIRNLGDQKPENLLETSKELVHLVLEDFLRDFRSANPQ